MKSRLNSGALPTDGEGARPDIPSDHDGTFHPDVSKTLKVANPTHLDATAALLKDTHLVGAKGLVVSSRTPDGPGTIRIRPTRGGREAAAVEFSAEAWGPGSTWLLDRSAALIGAEDDLTGFVPHHDALDRAIRRNPGFRIGRTERVFEAIVSSILGQKVQAKLAKESLRKLRWFHGERAPGPFKTWLLPTPEVVAALPYHEWHRINVEKKRARIIRIAASRANRLEECVGMSRSDAATRLQAFPGIGPWTTAGVMMTALGDPDAVLVGDYHLKNTVCWHLAGEERGTDERMLELLEPYAGHRGRVAVLLKLSGSAPKRGPRLSHMHFEDR